mmetsp:Transcript_22378/g.55405  ORF Transcript_22378/g.55405 Transcript_22378/m.55405 type:complete len:120 (-) Transcript_22378:374-733(-)|eukprot:CAMPEP_0174886396 /NCGR_PEP_ID=MMETSP0167-20121228/1630_1 /TAXON_ID=38298 /ORGANISM="Rhodella maculata, Strain CCMP736" /LENGTH=119 /DNA_ID=CAMNT_0016122367 /DNA_START=24 /DNA_END=383 /DNA_ORIENTATION=+
MPPAPASKTPECVFSKEELSKYDGKASDDAPVYMAVRDLWSDDLETTVFDVSAGRNFYGPGGPYASFAGHDASYALAMGSLDPADIDKPLDDCDPKHLQALEEWFKKFDSKYPRVGRLE